VKFCRRCGRPFLPEKSGDTLCEECNPVVIPFPVPPLDLVQDVRDGWGG
jgi:hypothetical protein